MLDGSRPVETASLDYTEDLELLLTEAEALGQSQRPFAEGRVAGIDIPFGWLTHDPELHVFVRLEITRDGMSVEDPTIGLVEGDRAALDFELDVTVSGELDEMNAETRQAARLNNEIIDEADLRAIDCEYSFVIDFCVDEVYWSEDRWYTLYGEEKTSHFEVELDSFGRHEAGVDVPESTVKGFDEMTNDIEQEIASRRVKQKIAFARSFLELLRTHEPLTDLRFWQPETAPNS